jgi:hypothetical protein
MNGSHTVRVIVGCPPSANEFQRRTFLVSQLSSCSRPPSVYRTGEDGPVCDPHLPASFGRVALRGVSAHWGRADVGSDAACGADPCSAAETSQALRSRC